MEEKYREISDRIEKYIREQNGSADVDDAWIRRVIDREIQKFSIKQYLSLRDKTELSNRIFHRIRGFDLLDELLVRKDITEIMVNGYDRVYIETNEGIKRLPDGFSSPERFLDILQKIAASCNRIVNESSPIVDAHLADGSRVNIVLPPVAVDGAMMTIRRFPENPYGLSDLTARGMLSEELEGFLRKLVKGRYNLLISGGTSTGKTTFLNALSEAIPQKERIITIEDSCELQLKTIENLVRLEVRQANVEGENRIVMRDLIRTALRMRPDRIIVGEVRGEEVIDMLQAMNTGHDGSLSTAHANSASDLLYRLETMVLMGMEIPLRAVRQQIASAIDIIIHLSRMADGKRMITEVKEVDGVDQKGEIRLRTLYSYTGNEFKKEAELKYIRKLEEYGGCSGVDQENKSA